MRELTDDTLREGARLIRALRSGALDDDELSAVAEQLDAVLPDPHWFNYAIDLEPELTGEEVVRRAFAYRPIAL